MDGTLSRGWALLAAGLIVFAIDRRRLLRPDRGRHVRGRRLLDLGWLVAMLLVAFAAWQPDRRAARSPTSAGASSSPPAVRRSRAGVVVLRLRRPHQRRRDGARLRRTARRDRPHGRHLPREPADPRRPRGTSRAPTRSPASATAAACSPTSRRGIDAARRARLVLCDLNGFKRYNDTLRPPGRRRAAQPPRRPARPAISAHGRAYRMGGDEFCALLGTARRRWRRRCSSRGAQPSTARASPSTLVGTVALPARPRPRAEALRLADARMYERKRDGRRPRGADVELLMRLLSERDPELSQHVTGVAELALGVAERLGLTAAQLRGRPRRRRAARHRQARHPGLDPRQAGPARPRRVGVHVPPHADRRADPRVHARPGRRRRARPREPRAPRRPRLPRRARRRRDPVRRAHRRRVRRLRRDGVRPPVPPRHAAARPRSRSSARGAGSAVRRRRRRRVRRRAPHARGRPAAA